MLHGPPRFVVFAVLAVRVVPAHDDPSLAQGGGGRAFENARLPPPHPRPSNTRAPLPRPLNTRARPAPPPAFEHAHPVSLRPSNAVCNGGAHRPHGTCRARRLANGCWAVQEIADNCRRRDAVTRRGARRRGSQRPRPLTTNTRRPLSPSAHASAVGTARLGLGPPPPAPRVPDRTEVLCNAGVWPSAVDEAATVSASAGNCSWGSVRVKNADTGGPIPRYTTRTPPGP